MSPSNKLVFEEYLSRNPTYTTSASPLANGSGALLELASTGEVFSSLAFSVISLVSNHRNNRHVRISITPKDAHAMKPGLNPGASDVLHTAF